MLNRLNFIKFIGIAGTVALSSCGGGGDVAGGLTDFSVSPAEFTWVAPKGDEFCSTTEGLENVVAIVGGTPPYRVVSSVPDDAIVSKTEVTGKNPTFDVTTGRGCMEVSVLVLDYHSRSTAFILKVEAGEPLEDEPTTPAL